MYENFFGIHFFCVSWVGWWVDRYVQNEQKKRDVLYRLNCEKMNFHFVYVMMTMTIFLFVSHLLDIFFTFFSSHSHLMCIIFNVVYVTFGVSIFSLCSSLISFSIKPDFRNKRENLFCVVIFALLFNQQNDLYVLYWMSGHNNEWDYKNQKWMCH